MYYMGYEVTMTTIGQGDVTLIRRDGLAPVEGLPREVTLAVGEESGHAHVIVGVDGVRGGVRLLTTLGGPVRVVGMPWRHAPIDVPAGTYEVLDWQREYAPGAIVRMGD